MTRAAQAFRVFFPKEVTSDRRRTYHLLMPSTRKKRKVSDLTVDDANTLLRTLAESQEQLDEEDEDLPTGLISGLEQRRKKLEVIPVRCSCCMRLNLPLPDISPLSTLIFLKLMRRLSSRSKSKPHPFSSHWM